MTIKFEDLAQDTQETADTIYLFLNLSTPIEVSNWIHERNPNKNEDKAWRSTQQDTDLVLKKWHSGLSIREVCEIERGCGKFMKLFGYPFACDKERS